MGDHRFSIKGTMYMHGIEQKLDMWINWSPDFEGLDPRVTGTIRSFVEKAMEKYHDELYEYSKLQEAERENSERELLATLKTKYETPE